MIQNLKDGKELISKLSPSTLVSQLSTSFQELSNYYTSTCTSRGSLNI